MKEGGRRGREMVKRRWGEGAEVMRRGFRALFHQLFATYHLESYFSKTLH